MVGLTLVPRWVGKKGEREVELFAGKKEEIAKRGEISLDLTRKRTVASRRGKDGGLLHKKRKKDRAADPWRRDRNSLKEKKLTSCKKERGRARALTKRGDCPTPFDNIRGKESSLFRHVTAWEKKKKKNKGSRKTFVFLEERDAAASEERTETYLIHFHLRKRGA